MEGLQKFLQLLNDNWTSILVCIGLVIGIVKKTQDYMSKSQDEKIEIAKKQIQTTILKMISDAEVDWQEWSKAGSIKRAQVIKQIYEESARMDELCYVLMKPTGVGVHLATQTTREPLLLNVPAV